MDISFTKLHGNGNDFIVIDEWDHVVIPDDMKGQFASCYCDRHFGIGAIGVIYVLKSTTCDMKMRLIQPDGSESDRCGNAIFCLAKFAYDAGYVKESCTVETHAGITEVTMGYQNEDFLATITLPSPRFDRKDIPATGGKGDFLEKIAGYEVHALNIGDPHAIVFADAVDAIDLGNVAPKIRHSRSFPEGANVTIVEMTGPDSIRIRTYDQDLEEEILSCGTGAAASAVMANRLGMTGNIVHAETEGGSLTISVMDAVKMEGPATTVFSGIIAY
ncbi:MAG: diaminopimelate epimerase [Methanomicrobiales archaeon]|nr:diaminopimelate epimerase [Methanomicrobiales archaeon]